MSLQNLTQLEADLASAAKARDQGIARTKTPSEKSVAVERLITLAA